MVTLLRWFKEKSMKDNPKKCQFIILGKTQSNNQRQANKGKGISKSRSTGSQN